MPGDKVFVPKGHIVNANHIQVAPNEVFCAQTPEGLVVMPAGHFAIQGFDQPPVSKDHL